MFSILIYPLLVVLVTGVSDIDFNQFQANNKDTVDYSSLKTCFVYGASKVADVDPLKDMGHKCTVTLDTWTESPKQAKELCESKFPYYVIESAPVQNRVGTSCTIQINLNCDPAYVQIHGKCYKTLAGKYTLAEAEKHCNVKKDGSQGKLAEFYSHNLEFYLDQIDDIYDAWVTVPNMKDYYSNEKKSDKGVYVQDNSFEFDVRKGTIMMDKEDSLHQAICEYTPPMTMAEMYYLAKIYSEIYPFKLYPGGAMIPTSSYMTIEQTDYNEKENIPHFSTKDFDLTCLSIGKILNVESYPMTANEEEFKLVQGSIEHHRFFMSSAYKDDGCYKADFRQFDYKNHSFQLWKSGKNDQKEFCESHSLSLNEIERFPTMAGMRAPLLCALHTFNYEYDACPAPPDWSEKPVRFTRPDRVFCHYINNKQIATHDEAVKACESIDAALSGFDSQEEFKEVEKHVKPVYPPGSVTKQTHYLMKYWGPAKDGITVDDHYRLGGKSPCENACDDKVNNQRHVASWSVGVAVDNNFLNHANHSGITWRVKGTQYVSFRADLAAFHLHTAHQYKLMFYICGRTADLKTGERKTGKVGAATQKG